MSRRRQNWLPRWKMCLVTCPGSISPYPQPIELRMNELISGMRSDVGIKIYGDDFDELVRISDEIQRVLVSIDGAADILVDQLTGQPTMQVRGGSTAHIAIRDTRGRRARFCRGRWRDGCGDHLRGSTHVSFRASSAGRVSKQSGSACRGTDSDGARISVEVLRTGRGCRNHQSGDDQPGVGTTPHSGANQCSRSRRGLVCR